MSNRFTQCDRVLARLRQGPATTMELISLGICCPTRRIFELRKKYKITATEKHYGRKRVVIYRLLGQAELPLEGAA